MDPTSTKLSLLALAVAALFCSACQTKERPMGQPQVKAAAPETTLIAVADVEDSEGKPLGVIRTYRFDDGNGRTVTRVWDTHERNVGYITDDGQAYILRAHGGTDLVAARDSLSRNVAALLGRPGASLNIKYDARLDTRH